MKIKILIYLKLVKIIKKNIILQEVLLLSAIIF